MSKYFSVIIFFVFISFYSGHSQDTKNQSIYLELLGNGGLYSLNYELNIYNSYNSRIGISYYGGLAGEMIVFPMMINHFNKDNKFSPELGLGFLIGSGKGSPMTEESNQRKPIFILTATIGLRFVSSDNEDLIRIAYTPFYNPKNDKYLNFGGVSFGIRF